MFIDAPGTGFGTVAEGADLAPFFSMEGDADAFARALTDWVARHRRWDSPKYFLGESYGTHRAAFLASSAHGMSTVPLDGIALLGQAVNIQETAERPGNVPRRPGERAVQGRGRWYHGAGSREHESVEDAIHAALDYAWGDLATAMLQGTSLPGAELQAVAARLSGMIGIPAENWSGPASGSPRPTSARDCFEIAGSRSQ